jgi:hypothetical protein
MKVRVVMACAAVLLGGMDRSAEAWGPDGHRIVAHIAEQRLTDAARARLADVLVDERQLSDHQVCNWPDFIRQDEPETAPWHYVDIPYEATSYDPDRDCPDGQCIVHQLGVLASQLASPDATREQRRRALCFVVHFMADLHQPLHCADRNDDRGGNLLYVRYPGTPMDSNLHAVWDSSLVQANMGHLGPLEYADRLNGEISGRQARRWARGGVADWTWESHVLAVERVYAGLPPAGGAPFALQPDYVAGSRKLVALQLKKAGVRLAALLNRTLQPQPDAVAPSGN